MQCSRGSRKLRGTAQLLAAGILLAALSVRAPAQEHSSFSPGFIDTLIAIVGAPRRIVIASEMPAGWLGAYSHKSDVIVIHAVVARLLPRHQPDSIADGFTRLAPDWILAHEFGHRFDCRRSHLPSAAWMRAPFAIAASAPYSNTAVSERWAEAFANAIDFLRFTAVPRPRPVVLRSLASREAFIPGTADVVTFLLRHPIYRRHPLNRRAF